MLSGEASQFAIKLDATSSGVHEMSKFVTSKHFLFVTPRSAARKVPRDCPEPTIGGLLRSAACRSERWLAVFGLCFVSLALSAVGVGADTACSGLS